MVPQKSNMSKKPFTGRIEKSPRQKNIKFVQMLHPGKGVMGLHTLRYGL